MLLFIINPYARLVKKSNPAVCGWDVHSLLQCPRLAGIFLNPMINSSRCHLLTVPKRKKGKGHTGFCGGNGQRVAGAFSRGVGRKGGGESVSNGDAL